MIPKKIKLRVMNETTVYFLIFAFMNKLVFVQIQRINFADKAFLENLNCSNIGKVLRKIANIAYKRQYQQFNKSNNSIELLLKYN